MKWELRLHAQVQEGSRLQLLLSAFNPTTSEESGGQRYMLGAINKWGCVETCVSSQSPQMCSRVAFHTNGLIVT